MNERILLITGNRSDHPSFQPGLEKRGYLVDSVPNGNTALKQLQKIDPEIVIVDAASLRTSGKRIVKDIHVASRNLPVILITAPDGENPEKNDQINKLDGVITLVLPFTLQKLLNRIRPLLPVEGRQVINQGPIRLDIEHQKVRCLNQSGRLTPHLVKLLRTLMAHPGEVIKREFLFSEVWETEYTADTRTLDVHVSWLRKIIEADPRHPKFIKTVRGIGYRLDI